MKKTANIFLITITVLFVLFCFSTCARISSDILGSSDSSSSNASGNSGGSSGGGGSEERITLDTPQNVSASTSGWNGNTITVTWDPVRGAKEYEIRWNSMGGYYYGSSTRTSWSTTVSTGGTRSFGVRAYDGNSGYSYWATSNNVHSDGALRH